MVVARPTPATLTLRLKNHKTTVCLYSTPTTPFTTLKSELLSALHATNTDGLLHGNTIPSDPEEVSFARPLDPSNLNAGWVSLEENDNDDDDDDGDLFGEEGEEEEEEEEEEAKSKSAAKRKSAAKKPTISRNCPQAADIKENAIIAFRFRDAQPIPREPEIGLGLDEGFVDEDEERDVVDPLWDVIMPKFEDTYGIGDLLPDDEVLTPKANKFADFGDV